MSLEFHQIDAFTSTLFSGNPAIVYRLERWLDDALMQAIAAEHNLAETAFLVREGQVWRIRWFTPSSEVPLCGHATLASAHVLFECYGEPGERLDFVCRSGPLAVLRDGPRLVLDFPARPAHSIGIGEELVAALGSRPLEAWENGQELMLVLADEAAVRACQPDLARLARLPWLGMIVTAAGDRHDFVSRYFAPAIGIDEDPVTGSTHCCLAPYWGARLGRERLRARQCSARGGELDCELRGERVLIAGTARLVASGKLLLD